MDSWKILLLILIKKYLQKLKIIRHLYIRGAKTNAEISTRFNISSPTSMKLLNQLKEEGLVNKQGRGKSEGGRKPELYGLQDHSFFVLSIHIERFESSMTIFDNNNNSISKIKVMPLDIAGPDAIDQLYEYANTIINSSGIAPDKIVCVGISMPGLVSSEEGKNFTYFLRKGAVETLQQTLEQKFAKPVLILNDAKSASLAEFRSGQAKTKKNVLVISMDGGLGLGIIMDGKMQSGASGFAGEFGHIPFVDEGLLCHCGKRGCLETVASGLALSRIAIEGVKSGESSLLDELSEQEIDRIEPQMIIEAAHKGDQFAISLKAWKVERWMVHSVLVFAVVMTIGVLYTFFTSSGSLLFIDTYTLRAVYGFLIGAAFAGVVGVGFYPVMGNRVWCRYGCPLAAYIGIVQRFKFRFRITTNGGQCISCGNCSTYCEMGIDVRWYARRGQNVVRASCVGCGVCASVCPRGVLKLENGKEEGRFGKPILIGNNNVQLISDIDYVK